jgi:hypothetical protein
MLGARTIGAFALAIGLIVAVGWAWETYLQSVAIECGETKDAHDRNATGQKDGPIVGTPFEHLLPPDRRSNQSAEPKDTRYECLIAKYTSELAAFTKALAYATAVLGIATVGLIILGIFQFWDARIVQRAHIFVLAAQNEFVHDASEHIVGMRLSVVWKNSGVTPASKIDSLVGATWARTIDEFEWGRVDQQTIRQPLVLGPGSEIASGGIGISPEHTHANFNGNGFQFLWGWARYRDSFPGSPQHVVEFCFRVIIEGELGPRPFKGRVNFAFHGEHNRYYDA